MDIDPTRLNHFNRDLLDIANTLKDLSDARDASRFDDDAPALDPDVDTLISAVSDMAGVLDKLVNDRYDDGSDY